MRILTVRQPWAWAIIHGGKDVENRVRNIAGDYRGPVAIHVGLRDDEDWEDLDAHAFVGVCPFEDAPMHNRYGCNWCRDIAPLTWKQQGQIIGVVDLTDVHLGSQRHEWCWHDLRGMQDRCSVWGDDDTYHLALANPRTLAEPIPYRGALGLRRLDDDTAARILAAIA